MVGSVRYGPGMGSNVNLGNIPREDIISGIDYVYSHNYTLNAIVQLHVP